MIAMAKKIQKEACAVCDRELLGTEDWVSCDVCGTKVCRACALSSEKDLAEFICPNCDRE